MRLATFAPRNLVAALRQIGAAHPKSAPCPFPRRLHIAAGAVISGVQLVEIKKGGLRVQIRSPSSAWPRQRPANAFAGLTRDDRKTAFFRSALRGDAVLSLEVQRLRIVNSHRA
jgi:hypothetical protein